MYQAGPAGYTETRTVQDGFVQIRARPVKAAPAPVPVRRPAPTPAPVRRPAPTPAPVQNNDSDLVARIIAQLTPFIRDTVSSSLQSGAPAPAPAPVPAAPRRPAPVPAPAPQPAGSIAGVFGVDGGNNVRLTSPDFNFAYDLQK